MSVLVKIKTDIRFWFILQLFCLLVDFSFSVKVIKEIGVISFHQRLKPSSKGEYLFSSLLFKAVHKLVVDVKHLRNIV